MRFSTTCAPPCAHCARGVLLFEVEDGKTETVLALRHQREDDHH